MKISIYLSTFAKLFLNLWSIDKRVMLWDTLSKAVEKSMKITSVCPPFCMCLATSLIKPINWVSQEWILRNHVERYLIYVGFQSDVQYLKVKLIHDLNTNTWKWHWSVIFGQLLGPLFVNGCYVCSFQIWRYYTKLKRSSKDVTQG